MAEALREVSPSGQRRDRSTLWVRCMFAIVIAALLLEWASQLSGDDWDWDVNHFMYFGQRLLYGELHWTTEFDDKLAINQFVFALPAALDSFRAWQVKSLAAMIGGAWAVGSIVSRSLAGFPHLGARARTLGAWAGGVATLFAFTFSPGGIHHINPMAASAAIAAIALLQRSLAAPGRGAMAAFVLSALLASVAVGMRPYLLPAVVVASLWVVLRSRPTAREGSAVLGWLALTGAFGVLANAAPYVIVGEPRVFLDGLRALGQELVPGSAAQILTTQEWVFRGLLETPTQMIFLLSFALAGSALIILLRRKTSPATQETPPARVWLDLLVAVLILPGLIELAILQKHFWRHYIQLFVPFAAIGTGALIGLMAHEMSRSASDLFRSLSMVLVTVLVVFLVGPLAAVGARNAASHLATPPAAREQLVALRAFLEDRPADQRGFLAPESMYLHFRLEEPRHGFPHAANTGFIMEGFWQDASFPPRFGLPTDAASYCAKLAAEGPDIVVLIADPQLLECLEASAVYRPMLWPDAQGGTVAGLKFFGRKAARQPGS